MNTHTTERQVEKRFPMTASRAFVDWLVSQNVALAFSTYQTGKLFLVGHNEKGYLSARTYGEHMGSDGEHMGSDLVFC